MSRVGSSSQHSKMTNSLVTCARKMDDTSHLIISGFRWPRIVGNLLDFAGLGSAPTVTSSRPDDGSVQTSTDRLTGSTRVSRTKRIPRLDLNCKVASSLMPPSNLHVHISNGDLWQTPLRSSSLHIRRRARPRSMRPNAAAYSAQLIM